MDSESANNSNGWRRMNRISDIAAFCGWIITAYFDAQSVPFGHPAAAEFGCLVQPGSKWLTLPSAAVAALELDTRPPRFPTYPGDKPADVSRCELAVEMAAAPASA